MPRLTRIYTRTGDDGTTGLGTGARIPKTDARIEAYGVVDQLNAEIGLALSSNPVADLVEPLKRIQNELFHCGADLCVPEADKAQWPGPRVTENHVVALESLMDQLSESLPPLDNFILPGGSLPAAQLHVARTICRNAERAVLRLHEADPINPMNVTYLNRLSDALFVMARYQNWKSGISDPLWNSRA